MSTEQKTGCSTRLDTPADIGEQLQVLQVHPRDNCSSSTATADAGRGAARAFCTVNRAAEHTGRA